MNDKFVYAPGPTCVRENVRLKRAKETTDPVYILSEEES
ncbi:hypothetical protein CLVI_07530 [Clostridium vincentii]|uniref:Uncharacterized protein n=1 Tax=Clostridium vincentii TaxID=52704 RepID=A0A2T0BIU2_9CLOT|nr:hypothetical protein CLVI_07530 [Clostridium vincentii]